MNVFVQAGVQGCTKIKIKTMEVAKPRKWFTLILVRHGQGRHNLDGFTKDELEFTNDDLPRTVDEPLTETGLKQARLVGERLARTRIDLAISSDLKRARQTGEAIVERNDTVDELVEWRVVRERPIGDFEGHREVLTALFTVEQAVKDKELLTWRPPGGGESVVDLRNRAREFLRRCVENLPNNES